jgi:hypothetical protein
VRAVGQLDLEFYRSFLPRAPLPEAASRARFVRKTISMILKVIHPWRKENVAAGPPSQR